MGRGCSRLRPLTGRHQAPADGRPVRGRVDGGVQQPAAHQVVAGHLDDWDSEVEPDCQVRHRDSGLAAAHQSEDGLFITAERTGHWGFLPMLNLRQFGGLYKNPSHPSADGRRTRPRGLIAMVEAGPPYSAAQGDGRGTGVLRTSGRGVGRASRRVPGPASGWRAPVTALVRRCYPGLRER